MELLIGFVYDVIGIRAIRNEKNSVKKLMMTAGFVVFGFLLVMALLLIR